LIICGDYESLALSVERIHSLRILVVETFVGEIFLASSHLTFMEESDLRTMNFINEMVMCFGAVVEQIDKDAFVVIAEGRHNIWV
jgi:hypothetical protein